MKKIILFIIIFIIFNGCTREQTIQQLQKLYVKVYPIQGSGNTFLVLDKEGSIHIIHYYPYSDITVFDYSDIESALNKDFTEKDINGSSK